MDATNVPKIDAEEILEGILEWVEIETPTYEADAVNALADVVEENLEAIGTEILRIPGRDGFGDILRARSPWGGEGPGILVLAHLDTVHPIGTSKGELPIRRQGDWVYGPGIYDMKTGGYFGYYAYRHLRRLGLRTPLPVTFLFLPEEEVGSPTSRPLIEAAARRAKYVLVPEPARDGGRVVTARKGVADFHLTVTGRPSHAGARHQDGRSAIREMARQVLRLEEMTDYERGITVSVGTIQGGTAINVVPASCSADIDVRVPDAAAAAEVKAMFDGLEPFDPDCQIAVTGDLNRPAFEKSEGITALLAHAQALAAELGFELLDTYSGGGSDGNFSAALGVPTLDGLGPDGAGAHTLEERIMVSSLAPRAALMIRLLQTLE